MRGCSGLSPPWMARPAAAGCQSSSRRCSRPPATSRLARQPSAPAPPLQRPSAAQAPPPASACCRGCSLLPARPGPAGSEAWLAWTAWYDLRCASPAGSERSMQRRGASFASGRAAPPCAMQPPQCAQQPAEPRDASPKRAAPPHGALLQLVALDPAQAHAACPPRLAFRVDEPDDAPHAGAAAKDAEQPRAGPLQRPAYRVEEPDDEPGMDTRARSMPAAPACVISTTTITRHAPPVAIFVPGTSLQKAPCPG